MSAETEIGDLRWRERVQDPIDDAFFSPLLPYFLSFFASKIDTRALLQVRRFAVGLDERFEGRCFDTLLSFVLSLSRYPAPAI